jgi:hypothetical protein
MYVGWHGSRFVKLWFDTAGRKFCITYVRTCIVAVFVRLKRFCFAVSFYLCFSLDTQSVNICALLAKFSCQILCKQFRR